ncbi:histidinol-phosphate transaminase [Paenibacillus sacheonensis]|uniref:Histidinol-phosphate aminotransferase n=1 Tax=Paenibacillus sacheonensis TaxID=742054 RepID=A0A7X5C0N1_9BACL|nr:histidinol-phosphate transaminase [Paenibacillus sacheonensis]MBM7569498.1 histidinol-phosphate aminotransferase [Paenibacillus sacheonensis]NBC71912.1 histidinol-phosphate transaminase [Paenibacillus sacheonensis]
MSLTTPDIRSRNVLKRMKPYSPGKPIWEVQRELGLERVVKLASNENPLGPSPKAVEAISELLMDIHRYPDAQAVDLRAAIAGRYELESEQIIITNGGDELITLVSEAFIEAGDEIIVPSPSFSEYEFGGQLMGAAIRTIALTEDYQYDVSAILEAVSERTKILYLCSPNNPTGTILTQSALTELLNALPPTVLVMLDSAYCHYVTEDDYSDGIEFVKAGYPVIVLQTFSKVYGLAGLRVGFGAASQSIIRAILQVKEPFNVNALALAAAAAAIADVDHVQRSSQLVKEERLRLYLEFEELGLPYTPSMSNFILVELDEDAEHHYVELMRKGVIVRYGAAWGLPRHVRISIGTPEENTTLLHALRAILQENPELS